MLTCAYIADVIKNGGWWRRQGWWGVSFLNIESKQENADGT